jgi:hypothetical protein
MNSLSDDYDDSFEEKDNVCCTTIVNGVKVVVDKFQVTIYNHKQKTGQEFKKEADIIIEYLINEGFINTKKFKVKIISSV